MAESTTTPNVSFAPYASLAALGLYLHQIDFLAPIREQVKIEQKKRLCIPRWTSSPTRSSPSWPVLTAWPRPTRSCAATVLCRKPLAAKDVRSNRP